MSVILRLLPAGTAFLGAMAWALSTASSAARLAVFSLLVVADITGLAVVWVSVRVHGHRAPERAARLFSLSWIGVVGWGATFVALLSWLGSTAGGALQRDPSTSGLIVGALVALVSALVGVATEVTAAWSPEGIARSSIARVYGGDFPRLAGGGADPAAYVDGYRAIWDDPALMSNGEVVVGWGLPARHRRLELVAAALGQG